MAGGAMHAAQAIEEAASQNTITKPVPGGRCWARANLFDNFIFSALPESDLRHTFLQTPYARRSLQSGTRHMHPPKVGSIMVNSRR
jgi:hypothetical protein